MGCLLFLSIFGQCLHQVRLFGRGGPAADLAVGSINVNFVQSRSQLLKTPVQQGLGKGNGCPRAPEIFNRVAGAFEAAPRSGHWALQTVLQT